MCLCVFVCIHAQMICDLATQLVYWKGKTRQCNTRAGNKGVKKYFSVLFLLSPSLQPSFHPLLTGLVVVVVVVAIVVLFYFILTHPSPSSDEASENKCDCS